MQRKRRVMVEIEHRELTLTSSRNPIVWPPSAAAPPACPVCGAHRLLSLAEALSEPGFAHELLDCGRAVTHLHLGRSPGGDWWICGESLHSQ